MGVKNFDSLFGGKINTDPTSYIVYFCDALLMGGVIAVDSNIDLPGLKVDWKAVNWMDEK